MCVKPKKDLLEKFLKLVKYKVFKAYSYSFYFSSEDTLKKMFEPIIYIFFYIAVLNYYLNTIYPFEVHSSMWSFIFIIICFIHRVCATTTTIQFLKNIFGASLVVHWLRLCASDAGVVGSVSRW